MYARALAKALMNGWVGIKERGASRCARAARSYQGKEDAWWGRMGSSGIPECMAQHARMHGTEGGETPPFLTTTMNAIRLGEKRNATSGPQLSAKGCSLDQ